MISKTKARQLGNQAKAIINTLLEDDTEKASEYRLVASRIPEVVVELLDGLKTRENEAKELRERIEKLNDTIAERNVTISYLESQLERGCL